MERCLFNSHGLVRTNHGLPESNGPNKGEWRIVRPQIYANGNDALVCHSNRPRPAAVAETTLEKAI